MNRDMTQAVSDALQNDNVPGLVLVFLDFPTPIYACNAGYNFEWQGNTYLGLGKFGSIEPIEESAGLSANGINMTLSGVDPAMISIVMGEQYQGRACKIWYAPLDREYRVLTDPMLAFSGRIDVPSIEIGVTATITLAAESRLIDWERTRADRYNDASQQAKYPGDLGFQFIEQMVDKDIPWGKS